MSVTPTEWHAALKQLRRRVSDGPKSIRQIAEEIGITHPTLIKILSGETEDPYPKTKVRIFDWLENQINIENVGRYAVQGTGTTYRSRVEPTEPSPSPEEELLEYFLENADQMATFMRTSTEGLSPEHKRMVAFAILTGFKRMAVEQGMPIPPKLFELEKKFAGEPE